jgi:hypothetical protein
VRVGSCKGCRERFGDFGGDRSINPALELRQRVVMKVALVQFALRVV